MPDQRPDAPGFVVKYRRAFIVPFELLLMVVSNLLAFQLRFENGVPLWAADLWWQTLPWLVAIRALTFIPYRLYEGFWRYTSVYDLRALVSAICTSSLLFYVYVRSPLGPGVYPRSVFFVDALLLLVFLGGARMMRRLTIDGAKDPGRRVLIYGAGQAGEHIVREMINDSRSIYEPVGFVDDNTAKKGLRIHGVPVLGTRADLPALLASVHPDEILLAMPNVEPTVVRQIMRALDSVDLPIKTLPNLRDIIDGRVGVADIRSLAVEDLLTRAPIGLDDGPVKALVTGRRVLVTGAGGSIGSELCRQIAKLRPATLVMLDRYENSLHAVRIELDDEGRTPGLSAVIADICDGGRLASVMRTHRPEIVFHAAAHKHVPLMEENPCEAVKNNIRGTRLLAQVADAFSVDRFVMISTDKAVNPTSVMGASKRVAEMAIHAQALGSGTSFSIVRFGNVLGSNGSVVPRFMEQIKRGGPLTVTHPEMRRFFMTIPEAVQLVLHAAAQAVNGATYVLEMGEQVKLVDMARDMIHLAGLIPDEDIKIEYIGLRPGEKLYEELVGPDEEAGPSRVDKILRVSSRQHADRSVMPQILELEIFAADGDSATVRRTLRELAGGGVSDPADSAMAPPPPRPARAATPPEAPLVKAVATHPCGRCKTGQLRRSRARSPWERIRKEFTTARLFRCDQCGWRGWAAPVDDVTPAPIPQPTLPNLDSLDADVASTPRSERPQFAPRDLP
jgi:FlaA1/EpsC-like NDP-sugar epimerase